jgi:transcription-repair coupling factor (superfamily II helicase)
LIGLREGRFANPPALVQWITQQGAKAKLRQDMKLVVMRDWETPEERLKGSRQIMRDLVKLALAA